MTLVWKILACLAMGYLLGCLNGALLISKLGMHEDIREKGSGNAGLTNFIRSYGSWKALLVIVIDLGKIVLACVLATLILPEQRDLAKILAGAAAQIGHIFPAFFGWRGGKGILCSAGLAIAMDWRIFAIAFPLFVIIVVTTHYVSLGSMVATLCYAVLFVVFFTEQPAVWGIALFMSAMAIFMHRKNIVRLCKGTENKTYLRHSKQSEA
ncbi:MAG: glycerol-3-phosphate 1-O-acyltransferase PlsY [Oscillospiraceae bacterium]|nr:glycerol-3-phosphate 1-O-acyltransferase PlsY [Oscillospiraceae bacterium]